MLRFVLRTAGLPDLDLLCRHRRGMWEKMGFLRPGQRDPSAAVFRRWLRQRLRTRRLVGFILETPAGRVAASGCIWLQEVNPRPHHVASRQPYLLSMFTEPEFRRRGLALRIAKEAIRWCRARRHPWLALHASSMGQPLYEAFGFVPSNEFRRYFSRPTSPGARRARGTRARQPF